jgi:hypothetical protein
MISHGAALKRSTPRPFRAVDLAQDECLSKGITTFEDAGSPFATIDLLKRMAEDGGCGCAFG